jgi:hypothetical protein
MGGLLTVRPFLNRFPQVDILDPAQTAFHDAWVTGEPRITRYTQTLY